MFIFFNEICYIYFIEIYQLFTDPKSESKIDNAEYWLNEILKIKVNHLPSKLIKAAFRFYMGDKNYFNSLFLKCKLSNFNILYVNNYYYF